MTEPLCIKQDGAWTVLPYGQPVTNAEGVLATYDTVMLWEEGGEDWQAFDLARPDPLPSPPDGKILVGAPVLADKDERPVWVATYEDAPTPPAPVAPDNPTLGDWRVGLVLWKTSTGNRRDDLIEKIKALLASGHPLGPVADERVNYSNNVLRAELMLLKDAVGFTTDDVEESLWRADRVRQGDLSGVWPLPAEQSAAA